MSIVFLQGYLVYQDYQYRERAFTVDISEALSRALEKAKIHRAEFINEQFRSDLMSGEYVLMDSTINENGNKQIMIADITSNYNLVQVIFARVEDRPNENSFLQLLLNKNLEYVINNQVYFWQEALGEKLKALMENTDIDFEFLGSEFNSEMINLNIGTSYNLKNNLLAKDLSKLSSDLLIYEKWDVAKEVWVEFENPFTDILDRAYLSISLGFGVLITTGICFYFLLGFWRKEHRLSELKDVFIDNLAHELLTPITTLNLSLTAFENKLKDKNEKGLELTIAKEQLQKLDDISIRLHNAVSNEDNSVITGYTTLNEQVEYLKIKYLNESRLILNLDIGDDCLNIPLNIPFYYLQSVLVNLNENALKYGGRKKINVLVSASRIGSLVSITMADNGHGIVKSVQTDIFNKFYRHIRPGSDDPGGLGLGLYNVRQTLQHFNAKINFQYSGSKGTIFQILIPIHEK